MSTPHDDWEPDEQELLSELAHQLEVIRRRHAGDPPLDMLVAARADLLPDETQQRVANHLERSAWSRTLVAGIEEATDGQELDQHSEHRVWRRVREQTEGSAQVRASRAFPRWLYGAAAVAASILVAIVIGQPWNTPAPIESAPPTTPPRATTPAPPPIAAAPLQLPFSKPEIKLSAAALTWRSGAGGGAFQRDLKPAIDAYRKSDYATADAAFTSLAAKYPRAVEVPFYGGVSRMMRGDFAGAIPQLEKALALNDPAFNDDVAWHLAVAEQRTGRDADALRRLSGLCSAAGPLAEQACAGEKALRERTASRP